MDVEQLRDTLNLAGMARHVLRPDEVSELEALPAARRNEAFIAAWTRKEAYLKARGLGLGEMRTVAVSVDPHQPAVLRSADDDPDAADRWTLVDLAVDGGYRAALAVLGRPTVFRRTLSGLDDSGGR